MQDFRYSFRRMSATKVMMVFVLVLSVAMAADGNKKTNSSNIHHVGSLVAKARLSPVNATVNVTESNNSTTEKTMTRRSLGIDKSDGTR